MSARVVLAIDDSRTILRVVQSVLGKAGYVVHGADRGEEGLRLAKELQPSLVLLDFVMPHMNGYQVCRALADDAATRSIPVVLMSAKADEVGERFVKVMGIVGYVPKPFSPETLLDVVSRALSPGARAPEDASGPTDAGVDLVAEIDESTSPGEGDGPGEERLSRGATDDAHAYERLATMRDALLEAVLPLVLSAAREPRAVSEAWAREEVARRLPLDLLERTLAPSLSHAADAATRSATTGPSTPALAGDLARVSLLEVMQLLSIERQTGVLEATSGAASVTVFLRAGRVEFAAGAGLGDELRLGRFLVEREAIAPGDLDLFFQSRPAGSARLTGEQLVKLGYVTATDLRHALARQTAERLYRALSFSGGRFAFRQTTDLGAQANEAALSLGVDEILLAGARRMDEWHLLGGDGEAEATIYLRDDEAAARVDRDQLSREELAVLELVNARNTVRDIARQSRTSAFEVSRTLARLRSLRLVRPRVQPVAV